MPLELNLVPALLHDSRDMTVRWEGSPVLAELSGAEFCGIAQLLQKPRIAEVSTLEASSASRSCFCSRDRNRTRGRIMYEFHKKDSSKLSISNSAASAGLWGVSALVNGDAWGAAPLPVLHAVRDIEVGAIIKCSVAE